MELNVIEKRVVKLMFIFLVTALYFSCNSSAQNDTKAKGKKNQKDVVFADKSLETKDRVVKTMDEWKKILTAEQFEITRNGGTERAFTGKYHDHHERGIYFCVACGNALFTSDKKYDSGTGWPSFTAPVFKKNVKTKIDKSGGTIREEVLCARCDSHLGHVFNDGPPPTHLRYCMNSAALRFEKR